MDIDGARLLRRMAELSQIGGRPDGGVDRVAWSDADAEARDWVRRAIVDMGWVAESDAAHNVFGRAPHANRRRLLVGSHTDSVAAGGRFDGALGVVAALEVARTLIEAGDPSAEVLEIVDFADEEGVRFPCGYFGSRALTGRLDAGLLRSAGAAEILGGAGVDLDSLGSAAARLDSIAGYLELHVEQGPRLEKEGLAVAVATGILGFDRYEIAIEGRSEHGGTTPFDLRSDPVLAAATFISDISALVRGIDEDGTATVGALAADGGAINFVARRVRMTVEVRQPSSEALERTVQAVRDRLEAACRAHRCRASFHRSEGAVEVRDGVHLAVEDAFAAPVVFAPELVDACERACMEVGATFRRMPAGTWHDAGVVAGSRPAAMLLVPSAGGVTHSPGESTRDQDLVTGTRVLLRAVRHAAAALGLLAD